MLIIIYSSLFTRKRIMESFFLLTHFYSFKVYSLKFHFIENSLCLFSEFVSVDARYKILMDFQNPHNLIIQADLFSTEQYCMQLYIPYIPKYILPTVYYMNAFHKLNPELQIQ